MGAIDLISWTELNLRMTWEYVLRHLGFLVDVFV